MTKIEQQIQWLGEIHRDLIRVSQAIIPDSVTTAEDLASDAIYYTLKAITEDRCTITTRSRFVSYCKNLVRKFARQAFTRYEGDIRIDPAKARVSYALRPDQRQTAPKDTSGERLNPYEREETIE